MSWDLVWSIAVVGLVALMSYGYGIVRGFKEGVVAMRKEVERILAEEKEKFDEREETP